VLSTISVLGHSFERSRRGESSEGPSQSAGCAVAVLSLNPPSPRLLSFGAEGLTPTPGTQEPTGVSTVGGVCYWEPYGNEPQSRFPSGAGWVRAVPPGPSFLSPGTESFFHGGGEASGRRAGEGALCLHGSCWSPRPVGSTAGSCTECFFKQLRVFFSSEPRARGRMAFAAPHHAP